MQDLRLTLIQDHLAWENREANLHHFTEVIRSLERTDIIVLPEMFNSGFTVMPEAVAEPMNGPTITWMKEQSSHTGAALVGTLVVRDGNEFYNRLVWVSPAGSIMVYDKRHLFRMGGEHERFSMGSRRAVINFKGWHILPLICYDLRFPVWSQNRMKDGRHEYDLLLYLANWPASRNFVWKSLLQARALENQCFVAGVNRVGTDGHGINYAGESRILSAKAEIITELNDNKAGILHANLNHQELTSFREKFQVGLDWDTFYIPGTSLDQDSHN